MVDDTKKIGSTLDSAFTGTSTSAVKKKNDELGKNEFLQLLIAQLKNQDPEAPVDSKEFAVQLAQFTSVEKLISIDDKLGAQNQAASAMAGFLGQDVILDGSSVEVKGGAAGSLQLDMSSAASAVTVEFADSNGNVIGSKDLGPVASGKQEVSLNGLGIRDGSYQIKVTALSAATGNSFSPDVSAFGRVTGFIPGADPTLIVDGREVKLAEVKEVRAAKDESSQL